MSQKLVVASLVRNEAHKYFASCMREWEKFADRILVLDDDSDDDTRAIALDCPIAIVETRGGRKRAWGAESRARSDLWDFALSETRGDDVILFLDADMVPARNPRDLIHAHADTYFFTLYDLWSAREYRSDFWWRGHINPRAWMIRRPSDDFVANWTDAGIHCGHLAPNYVPENSIIAPSEWPTMWARSTSMWSSSARMSAACTSKPPAGARLLPYPRRW